MFVWQHTGEHRGMARNGPSACSAALFKLNIRPFTKTRSVLVEIILPDGVQADEDDIPAHAFGVSL